MVFTGVKVRKEIKNLSQRRNKIARQAAKTAKGKQIKTLHASSRVPGEKILIS